MRPPPGATYGLTNLARRRSQLFFNFILFTMHSTPELSKRRLHNMMTTFIKYAYPVSAWRGETESETPPGSSSPARPRHVYMDVLAGPAAPLAPPNSGNSSLGPTSEPDAGVGALRSGSLPRQVGQVCCLPSHLVRHSS